MHTYKVIIREGHLDTFGHVNNARYLDLYEEARWDLITNNGYGLQRVQELKQGPVILDLNLTFKKEITNREEITIETEPTEINHPLIMNLKQRMVKADGTIASTLDLKVGLMDLSLRKLIAPTEKWLAAIKC